MIKDLLLAYLIGMLKGDALEMIWAISNVLISLASFSKLLRCVYFAWHLAFVSHSSLHLQAYYSDKLTNLDSFFRSNICDETAVMN